MNKKIWIGLGILLIVLVILLVIAFQPQKPEEASLEILALTENDALSVIDDNNTLTFCPLFATESKAIIFYPGGKVDYRAYTPTMYQIAQAGVPVVVVKMPLNMAFFGINRADDIIDAPVFICGNAITEWYVGGHSLGGAMAAQYASQNLDKVTGLILWGSYPGGSVDLTDSNLHVLSIFGSADLVSSYEEVDASREQLPLSAQFFGISGANHAQFGDYGLQSGDGEALISPSEQWRLVTDLTLQFMYSTPQN
jgi:dienelactone hydrolase